MDGELVTITLTEAQAAQVLRARSERATLAELLTGLIAAGVNLENMLTFLDDPRYSSSTLRALLVLGTLPADGAELELTELAARLHASPSTTHRYLQTWLLVGIVEQDTGSRRYRLARDQVYPG